MSLDEAFQWLDDYMSLLKLRYTNIELQVKPMERRKDEYILSQSLQVLVENAVKHNAMNQHEKLTLYHSLYAVSYTHLDVYKRQE